MSILIRVEFPSDVEPSDSDLRPRAAETVWRLAVKRGFAPGAPSYQVPLRQASFTIKDVSRDDVASLLDEAQTAARRYESCEVVAIDLP